MLASIFKKVFGSKNDREIKRLRKIVNGINQLEPVLEVLSDDELKAKTAEFKQKLEDGTSLNKILPEAFAVVREASRRVMGMRHFDVQMIGAMVLNEGRIPEMRTGEGKTLMSTLAAYLNGVSGKGVHVVTVNEYLARRDAEWMRPLFEFLGLTVGVIHSGQQPQVKREAYACDITYGTNNEFGFDYLRDNMAFSANDRVQRGLNFAIVDEVDSILIDEARTPLVISGQAEDSSEMYRVMNKVIPSLVKQDELELDESGQDLSTGHYVVDEKQRSIEFTEAGHLFVEEWLIEQGLLKEGESLYAPHNLSLLHHAQAALKAHAIFQKNVDYIVRNGEVMIVDEHTGRIMPGRRWGEGIHQAIEAKEGVTIQKESQTLASTTFQNYFRLYNKLSGMTGTADTEAFEFHQIYGLQVTVVPTNKAPKRIDANDLVYLTEEEKYDSIIEEIKEKQADNRPCLVGTASIEASERISKALEKAKIDHNVLNAKQHEREAEIIAQAGRPGAVTIATNMAGRGTDIVLGGNSEAEIAKLENPTEAQIEEIKAEFAKQHDIVINAGGLHIIGTERHESRRIDNQLRGRAGRQGDPGSSRFFLSLEDNLMRIFASDRVRRIMQTLGMEKGEAIEHRMVSNAIEKAQRKVEGRNFDMRKALLEYDDVANDQRKVVYGQRSEILDSEDLSEVVNNIRTDVVQEIIDGYIPPQSLPEQWDVKGLEEALQLECNIALPIQKWLDEDKKLFEEPLREKILSEIANVYKEKEQTVGEAAVRGFEKQILLQVLDQLWKEHLATMDHLRQGIHLRGYAQKNPKQEYKRESFALFEGFLSRLKAEVVKILCHVQVKAPEDVEEIERQRREAAEKEQVNYQHDEANSLDNKPEGEEGEEPKEKPFVRGDKKVGRNEPCPCGSGKKYKQCCGKIQ